MGSLWLKIRAVGRVVIIRGGGGLNWFLVYMVAVTNFKYIVFDLCSHIIYSVQGKWLVLNFLYLEVSLG